MKFLIVLLLAFGPLATSGIIYTSPSCGPAGGTTAWACGAWPSKTPPTLGATGSVVRDADTGNRILRVTTAGSFGEPLKAAFKGFDAGWKALWNSNSTRFIVQSWGGLGRAYWIKFDPATMSSSLGGVVPSAFGDYQFDTINPDLIVGLVGGVAKSYNVVTGAWATIFDPKATGWSVGSWISAWGGPTVCIASVGQDTGTKTLCYDRQSGRTWLIDYRSQTINGLKFPVLLNGALTTLPATTTHHTIMVGLEGDWLAVDTHGNALCSVPGLANYASTTLFLNLHSKTGHEWTTACGGTHWAYGWDGAILQSASPKWTATGAQGPCNSDSRGILRRETSSAIDLGSVELLPCSFFQKPTWAVSVHLAWPTNVANDAPVILSASNEGATPQGFMTGELDAVETIGIAYGARLWRFAQLWNEPPNQGCGFLAYSSPSVSPNGRWAVYPSTFMGATGAGGPCTNGRRTDVFVWELK